MPKATSKRKIRYALVKQKIYSQELHWGKEGHTSRQKFNRLLSNSVQKIVANHLKDNMKAPFNNPAKPALFAPSSFNIYFGDNIGTPVKRRQVVRAAYATNSGALSIGLDPRHAKLNYMYPALSDLRDIVREKMKEHYSSSPHINCDFNHVSVKVYFQGKKTKAHTDIEFNWQHTQPKLGNSQVPSTPVAIVCLGDDKYLKFIEYCGEGKGEKVLDKKSCEKSITFLQKNRSIIVLDPRDEELNERNTFWKHKSELEDPKNGVSVSLMFRVVQASTLVHSDTGFLVNPKVPGTGVKEKQFDKGWREIKKNGTYRIRHDTILKEICSALAEHY